MRVSKYWIFSYF